jgi:UDP:flavonoid glycosyltransferase YjiC (YdhE family)
MARICALTADGGGNLAVMLATVAELVRRGNEVDLVVAPLAADVPVPRSAVERGAMAGAHVTVLDPGRWSEVPVVDPRTFEPDLRAFAVAVNWAWGAPTIPATAEAARAVLDGADHDAMIVDWSPAPAIAAEALGVPSVLLVPQRSLLRGRGLPLPGRGTVLADVDPAEEAIAAERYQALLDRHVLPWMNEARVGLGLSPVDHVPDVDGFADLTLIAASPAFDLVPDPPPPTARWVGTFRDLGVGNGDWHAPWPADDPRPLVVMSPTTTHLARAQVPFVRAAIEALAALAVRGLVTVGPHLDPARFAGTADVRVVGAIPHTRVLPGAALMITHAGHGTLMTALRHGVPVVCAPSFGDQPDNAARVVDLGLGVRVPQPPPVDVLLEAIATVLEDGTHHERAQAFADVLRAEDGATSACDEIEALVRGRR